MLVIVGGRGGRSKYFQDFETSIRCIIFLQFKPKKRDTFKQKLILQAHFFDSSDIIHILPEINWLPERGKNRESIQSTCQNSNDDICVNQNQHTEQRSYQRRTVKTNKTTQNAATTFACKIQVIVKSAQRTNILQKSFSVHRAFRSTSFLFDIGPIKKRYIGIYTDQATNHLIMAFFNMVSGRIARYRINTGVPISTGKMRTGNSIRYEQ